MSGQMGAMAACAGAMENIGFGGNRAAARHARAMESIGFGRRPMRGAA